MSWNYRIIRTERPGGGASYAIHEAYYESDLEDQLELDARKAPSGICPTAHEPLGLSVQELKKILDMMQTAFNKEIVEGARYHVKVRYERKRTKSVAEDMNRNLRESEKEAKEWKKAYLKANSERILLQKQVEELRKLMAGKPAGS